MGILKIDNQVNPMELDKTPFRKKIQGPVRLPALNEDIKSLMNSLADEDINCPELAKIINVYPEISARLISLANSVWSAPAKPIIDIESSCIRLGLSVIKSVSIAIAVSSFFDSGRCPGFDVARFWTRSMLVAEGANLLAAGLPKEIRYAELKKAGQTAGLLHNLGLLWLADNLPKETDQAIGIRISDPSSTLNQALKQCTGADYCEVNSWIAEQWKLPGILTIAMQHHLDSSYQGEAWEITLLVNAAIKLVSADLEDVPDIPALMKLGIDQAQQMKVYRQLVSKREKMREMAKSLFVRKNKALR